MKKYFFALPVLLIAILVVYKVQSNAFIYAFGVLLSYVIAIVYLEKRARFRLGFIYLGSVLLAFFLAEIYYSFQYDQFATENEVIYGEGVTRVDPILGLVPIENSQVHSRAKLNNELIYDVTITIDEYGRRVMPERQLASNDVVLFFGCSFTFGNGVEDDETLPHQFQEAALGRYQAVNYGFSMNGAHQTLAIMENKLEQNGISNSTPKAGIYSMITDHAMRGTYALINSPSPRYRFNKDGELQNTGIFSNLWFNRVLHYMGKSNVMMAINPLLERLTQSDIDLMVSMTERSAQIFEERYDGTFYCLLWRTNREEYEGLYERILEALNDRQIKVIEIEDIIEDYSDNTEKFLIPHDGHPNALANKKIAAYLVEFLRNEEKIQ